jgi:hypothetical protein
MNEASAAARQEATDRQQSRMSYLHRAALVSHAFRVRFVRRQFFKDTSQMVFDSKCADSQDTGYFRGGLALLGPIHDFGFATRQSVIFPAYMRCTERVVRGKRINLPQCAIKIRKENIEGIE